MEFKQIKSLIPPTEDVAAKKNEKHSKEPPPKITCFLSYNDNEMVVAGTNLGKLLIWSKKGKDQKYLLYGKEYNVEVYSVPNQHKGEIKCISYELIRDQHFFITGSVDRTVKIWEADLKNKSIVQTLAGHGGTVLQFKYNSIAQVLVTCSTDKTIRIWKLEPGRELMYYPSFYHFQTISHFSDKPMIETRGLFVSAVGYKSGDHEGIYAGDSEGTIHFIKQDNYHSDYYLATSLYGKHRITIIQMLVLSKENMIFTISYDQKVMGFEIASNKGGGNDKNGLKQFLSFKNPFKAIFTAMAYDNTYHELFVSDELGNVWDISIHTQSEHHRIHPFDKKILGMEFIDKFSMLLLCTDTGIEVLKIKRGVNVQNLIGTHKGPVIKIIEVDPVKLTHQPTKEPPKLFSTSADNTIRQWDVVENQAIGMMENENCGEIVTMALLKKTCLLVTGHDDGNVKLWNPEVGKTILLETKNKQKPHKDIVCALATGVVVDPNSPKSEEKEYLFTAGYDGKVAVWEFFEKAGGKSVVEANITPQHKYEYIPYPDKKTEKVGREILCLLFDFIPGIEGGGYIYAAGTTGCVYVHKLHNQREPEYIATIMDERDNHIDAITCMAMERNILFTGSDDCTIKLWEVINYSLLFTIKQHEEPIRDMLIIEETGHLVTCSDDGKIYIWNYPKRTIVEKIEKKEGFLCLAYSCSLKKLYVGTEQHNLLCYPIDSIFEREVSEIDFTEFQEPETIRDPSNSIKSPTLRSRSPTLARERASTIRTIGRDRGTTIGSPVLRPNMSKKTIEEYKSNQDYLDDEDYEGEEYDSEIEEGEEGYEDEEGEEEGEKEANRIEMFKQSV